MRVKSSVETAVPSGWLLPNGASKKSSEPTTRVTTTRSVVAEGGVTGDPDVPILSSTMSRTEPRSRPAVLATTLEGSPADASPCSTGAVLPGIARLSHPALEQPLAHAG